MSNNYRGDCEHGMMYCDICDALEAAAQIPTRLDDLETELRYCKEAIRQLEKQMAELLVSVARKPQLRK